MLCLKGHIKVVEQLLNKKADPNIQNSNGFTSLMCASCSEVVELLLEAGANPNTQVKTFTTLKDMISDLPGDILLQLEVKSCNLLNVSVLKGTSFMVGLL